MINNAIHKKYYALIKFCKICLNLDNNHTVTENDVNIFKNKMIYHLEVENKTPKLIAELYSIKYSDFGMFLKKCLNIKLKSIKEANKIYYQMNINFDINKKKEYQNQCKFRFGIYDYPNMLGYELLEKIGIFSHSNINGASRDHMFSIEDGWRNNIDYKIISHPANCRIISQYENSKKNMDSIITLDELLLNIKKWNDNCHNLTYNFNYKKLPKSEEHKKKISETIKRKKIITNGLINLVINKEDEIPDGFRKGFIRKNKTGALGQTRTDNSFEGDF